MYGFVKLIGIEIFFFIGFGFKVIDLEEFVNKYWFKVWFVVMEMFFEEIMEDFNFDKGFVFVVMCGEYGEKIMFYGFFEG